MQYQKTTIKNKNYEKDFNITVGSDLGIVLRGQLLRRLRTEGKNGECGAETGGVRGTVQHS